MMIITILLLLATRIFYTLQSIRVHWATVFRFLFVILQMLIPTTITLNTSRRDDFERLTIAAVGQRDASADDVGDD